MSGRWSYFGFNMLIQCQICCMTISAFRLRIRPSSVVLLWVLTREDSAIVFGGLELSESSIMLCSFCCCHCENYSISKLDIGLFFSCQDPVSDIESKKSYDNICNQIGHVSFVCQPPLSLNSRNMNCPSRFCNHFGESELSESSTIFCSFSCCHCENHSIW